MKSFQLIFVLILFTIIGTAQTYVHNNQQIVQAPYKPGATTNAVLYIPKGASATHKVPLFFYWPGLGHDADKGTETLFTQGLPLEIANGWQPPFAVIACQTPAEALGHDNPGYWWSTNSYTWACVDNVKTWAVNTFPVDVTQMYDMGISAGGNVAGSYTGGTDHTPKYKMAGVFVLSGTIASGVGYQYVPAYFDVSKFQTVPFYGAGSLLPGTKDVQGTVTKSVVDAINKLYPGEATFVDTKSPEHDDWGKTYLSTSPVWSWFASKSGLNMNMPPLDTITKPPVVVVVTPPVVTPPVVTPPASGNTIYVTKNPGSNDISLNNFPIKSGMTVVIPASLGTVGTVWWKNFKADSLNQVQIVDGGSQTTVQSFNFYGVQGVHIHPSSNKVRYAFLITSATQSGAGLSFTGRNANLHVDSVEMYNLGSGCWWKIETADDNCSDSLRAPNWWLHDLSLTYSFVHKIRLEGGYAGSTAPDGTKGTEHGTVYCNGVTDTSTPPRLYNIVVEHNLFQNIGRQAFQIATAEMGNNSLSYNEADSIGYDMQDTRQGYGFIVGNYFTGKVWGNKTRYTRKAGFFYTGFNADVEYNDCDYAGNNGMGQTSNEYGMYVVSQKDAYPLLQSAPYQTKLVFKYNNFGTHNTNTSYGLFIEDGNGDYASNGNQFIGNIGTYRVPVGVKYDTGTVVTPPVVVVTPSVDTTAMMFYLLDKKTQTATFINYNYQPIKVLQNIYKVVEYINAKNRLQFNVYYYSNKTKAVTIGYGVIN